MKPYFLSAGTSGELQGWCLDSSFVCMMLDGPEPPSVEALVDFEPLAEVRLAIASVASHAGNLSFMQQQLQSTWYIHLVHPQHRYELGSEHLCPFLLRFLG